uniref:thiol oxidase n=1 Tax=viral metagenome TaxID=1070528 RepID=A0A6C0AQI8_9ZZZZ
MTKTRKNRNIHNKTKKRIFTKKEYSSGDGMLTTAWGPAIWHYLHMMSFNYPIKPTPEDKKYYREFIVNLQYVLPCKYCRINLKNNFKEKPIQMCDMASRETFSRYVYELHELINKMLKKTSNLSYCDVRERYEHFRSRCTEEKPRVFTFKKTSTVKKEKGCTEPLYGKKSKCVINIVPQEDRRATFQMDKKCIKTRD